jgi:predicted glycoside hydrolase/deacetylase ChbG (UPF0249 family)
MSKQIVINADDFGISQETNLAILQGLQQGVLTSTCLMANGDAFDHALVEIMPQVPNLSLGVHLNIIEGKSLLDRGPKSLLCDSHGYYNNGYLALWQKSYNKAFLNEVEADFRSQIEQILSRTRVCHIDSHVHVHAIPNIFELTCKLAQEYEIPYIRTQHEIPYMIPSFSKNLDLRYPVNLLKNGLLNYFTSVNQNTLKKYNLLTNDYFIGVAYTGYIDEDAILYGLRAIKAQDCVAEIIMHPTVDATKKSNYQEFLSVTNPALKTQIADEFWAMTSHRELLKK